MTTSLKTTIKKVIVILLILTATLVINRIIIGNTFTYRTDNTMDTFESYDVTFKETGIVRVLSSEYKNGKLAVKLEGIQTGETMITFTIYGENGAFTSRTSNFYVHSSGFITEGGYFGTLNNFYIFGIEMVLFLFVLLVLRIIRCLRIRHENMYSYALVGHLGVALFLFLTLVLFILVSLRQGVSYYRIGVMIDVLSAVFKLFAFAALPILFVLSAFLVISNISLMRHEGKSLTNTLGILLGLFLFALTFGAAFLSRLLMQVSSNVPYLTYRIRFIEAFFFSLPVYLECLMVSTLFCTLKAQKHVPDFDKDYIIILGCAIRQDGSLTPLLKGRADRAVWFANRQKEATGKDIIFVPSGGQGSDEVIAEGQAIKRYLLECGIDEEHILTEDRSENTQENMEFSKKLIEAHKTDARVAFSTTGYHVFRSGNIARKIGLDASGVGSPTKWYFYVNALIREFAANLSAEKARHIINIVCLMLYAIAITFLSYITNML